MRWKRVALSEAIVIVALVIISGIMYATIIKDTRAENRQGLLSNRIYAESLKPGTLLIFNLEPLQKGIEEYLKENKFDASVYIMNMRDGASIGINENVEYEPVSLNKLPIAIITLRKVQKGEISMDTLLPIVEEDRDASSGSLARSNVTELSVRELLHYMLAESDNTALHVLARRITLQELASLSNYLNYYNNDITQEKLESETRYAITAKSTSYIFSSLYLSTLLTPENSEFILETLTNTSFDIKKVAALPDEVIVAQKYGSYNTENQDYFHSCGIMYIQSTNFFYCILTRNVPQEKAVTLVGTIVHETYEYVIQTRDHLSKGKI